MLIIASMKKVILALFTFSLFFFILPTQIYASPWAGCEESISSNVGGTTRTTNVATLNCLPIVFNRVINFAVAFAGVVALFFIVYSGARYITSGGDPKGVESAKNTLTWSIIGLAVVLLAWAIIYFISIFTGASCIQFFGFENC